MKRLLKMGPDDFHLLMQEITALSELISEERLVRREEIDRLRIEVRALRETLGHFFSDFDHQFRPIQADLIQRFDPESEAQLAPNLQAVPQEERETEMNFGPKVRDYMTSKPITISRDASINEAVSCMRKYSIRHLPVVDSNGSLVGLITDRDIKVASAFEAADQIQVDGVMIAHPYSVESVVGLRDVVLYMAENRYGCALILQDGNLVGIFTADDGLRVLGEMIEQSGRKIAA